MSLLSSVHSNLNDTWVTGTTYNQNATVIKNGYPIICQTTHTAGNYFTDVLNNKWLVVGNGKNPFYNGDMAIDQRRVGASYALTNAAFTYGLDRWGFIGNASGSSASRVSSGLTGLPFAAKFGRDNGATGTAAHYIGQALTTSDTISYAGKTITFSFWAKAGANYSATSSAFQFVVPTGTGTDQSLVAMPGGWTGYSESIHQTINLTTTWTRYSYTSTIGSAVTQIGTFMLWTPVGTAGADDNVYITGVMLNEGPAPAIFQTAGTNPPTDLAMCKKFYRKSFPQSVAPAQNAGLSGSVFFPRMLAGANTNTAMIVFDQTMRTNTPTMTFYNPQAANAFPRDVDAGVDFSSFAVYQTGDNYQTAAGTANATGSVGDRCFIHYTAEAEL